MLQDGARRTAQIKQRHHTPEQVIRKLAEGKKVLGEGKPLDEVVRHLEITASTWHRWRNQYGGMNADDAKKLKELERENVRLKRIVADQALDMLKELNRETSDPVPPPACRCGPPRAVRGVGQNVGPVRLSASPGPPNASRHRFPVTKSWLYEPSYVTSHAGVPAGAGGGRPLRPGSPAGWSTQQAYSPPVSPRRPACALQEEDGPDARYQGGRRRHVPDPAKRDLGPSSAGGRDKLVESLRRTIPCEGCSGALVE